MKARQLTAHEFKHLNPTTPNHRGCIMRTCLKKNFDCIWPVVALAALLFGLRPSQAQMVDLNANGMSDIWELLFGASGLDPNGDADADGASNRAEATAGTDPFDGNSNAKISGLSSSTTNF